MLDWELPLSNPFPMGLSQDGMLVLPEQAERLSTC